MKGLFLSEYLFLPELPVASLSLCKRLGKEFEIDFLFASPTSRIPPISSKVHLQALPQYPIYAPPGPDNLTHEMKEEQKKKRLAVLEKVVKPPYAFFMTEIFPFGKYFLRREVFKIMDRLKKANPHCLLVGSIPDVLNTKEKKVIDFGMETAERFDAIFVHSDPSVIMLEESIPISDKVQKKLIYTGFVPNTLEPASAKLERQKRILVYVSLREHYEVFVRSILRISNLFPGYEFAFVLPSNLGSVESMIVEWSHKREHPKLRILPDKLSEEEWLRTSDLAITVANNFILDIVYTKTRGLVVEIGSNKAEFRLRRFAEHGLINKIGFSDLMPDRLAPHITQALEAPFADHHIDFAGADHTLQQIKKMLAR